MMPDKTPTTWTNAQQLIAFTLVASFIGVIFVWMMLPPKGVDQSVLTVVNMLLGALVAKFTTIVDFYFGSSQGSKDKDDANSRMVATLTGTGPGAPPGGAIMAAANVAAEKAAPPAAEKSAPPAAEAAAPAAAEAAVAKVITELKDKDHV